MNICLKKADPAKKEILFRLLQYSLFEESLHDQNTINEDALFDYPWFDLYFILRCIRETGKSLRLSEAGRHICSGKM